MRDIGTLVSHLGDKAKIDSHALEYRMSVQCSNYSSLNAVYVIQSQCSLESCLQRL